MLKKVVICLVACLAVLGGYGCSGGGAQEEPPAIEYNPSLERAVQKEKAGEPLSGKEKRILDDARAEGIID